MGVREVLVAARALIADPERWCQGTGSDAYGRRCMHQAIYDAAGRRQSAVFRAACKAIIMEIPTRFPPVIATFNDASPHFAVIALFDTAIAKLPAVVPVADHEYALV